MCVRVCEYVKGKKEKYVAGESELGGWGGKGEKKGICCSTLRGGGRTGYTMNSNTL